MTATVVIGGVSFTNQPIIVRGFPEEAPDMMFDASGVGFNVPHRSQVVNVSAQARRP